MKVISGEMLDRVSALFTLRWSDNSAAFVVKSGAGVVAVLKPDELVQLGRELIAAAVNKGE